jgi:phosphatidylinositol glycan class N
MFARGATPGRVDAESYGEEEEDFTADACNLDIWVLDRLKNLLKLAETDAVVNGQLRAPGAVFFLHLLGLDTTGHTYRPKSAEYVGNLMVVDVIVKEVERLLSDFYGEAKRETAFIFSADHGMSNKGNHGDGEPDNTRTPLVAWGAGVRSPRARNSTQEWRDAQLGLDSYYAGWGDLNHSWRSDVNQADVTALMAGLLGVNMPANSEGILPLDYLNISKLQAAKMSLANALEVLEMYRVKHEQRENRMIRFVPFSGLPSEGHNLPGTAKVEAIREEIKTEKFDEALASCAHLIDLSLSLQTYDWLLLVGIVLMGYLGSILSGLAFLLRQYVLSAMQLQEVDHDGRPSNAAALLSGGALAVLFAKFAAEHSPPTYYLYAAYAAFYWFRVLAERRVFAAAWQGAKDSQASKPILQLTTSLLVRVVLSLLALELMVYGYLERLAWTAGFVLLGFVWPAVGISSDFKSRHDALILAWTVACGACGTFTITGVDKVESVPFLICSGLLFFLAGSIIVAQPAQFPQTASW